MLCDFIYVIVSYIKPFHVYLVGMATGRDGAGAGAGARSAFPVPALDPYRGEKIPLSPFPAPCGVIKKSSKM